MCGFVVVLNRDPKQPVERGQLERASAALAHRGPDDAQLWTSKNLGFAFRRLAVMDPTPAGRQPRLTPAGALVFNGELYGYRHLWEELRQAGVALEGHSDSEVLATLLAREGVQRTLTRIQGMFAFAWWDSVHERLTLVRDPLGQKPLYLWRGPERIVAASELKAITAWADLPRRLDPRALAAYGAFFTVPEPLCALEGVEKLEPGEWIELDRCGEVRGRGKLFENPEVLGPARGSLSRLRLEPAAAELRARLRAAIRTHLVADVPLGAFLSGGLDSAGVVALAAEARRESGGAPLTTFTATFTGSPLDEAEAARETAAALGTEHHQVEVQPDLVADLPRIAWHLDEPFAVASAAALYYVAREARRHVTVALSGDGADELFGGYLWRHGPLTPHQVLGRLPDPLRRALARVGPPASMDLGGADSGGGGRGVVALGRKWWGALRRSDAALYADIQRYLRLADMQALLEPGALAEEPATARFAAFYEAPRRGSAPNRALYADLRTTLSHEMLAKVDRMSMAHGLEVRVPFLDPAVVSWALELPAHFKAGARESKRVLRRALVPLLPTQVRARKKQGFNVPLDAWFRGPLRNYAHELLSALGERAPFRRGAPAALLERHLKGPIPLGMQVYALVSLEQWCRVTLDRPDPSLAP